MNGRNSAWSLAPRVAAQRVQIGRPLGRRSACTKPVGLFLYSVSGNLYDELSRLERRIMDAVYQLGTASVADVVEQLDGEDVHHSIRVTMSTLEKKGFLKHRRRGTRNVYAPTVREERARKSAMDNLIRTFFHGSPERALLGILDRRDTRLSPEDVEAIRARIVAANESDPQG